MSLQSETEAEQDARGPSSDGRKTRTWRVGACTVCNHPDRARIEALRVAGTSLRALELQFGVGKDAVCKHFKNHMSQERKSELLVGPARIASLVNAAADESRGFLDYLTIARSVLFNQFLAAAEAGDRNGVVGVAGRLLESLRELGKLTGELREVSGITVNNTLNLVTSPQFIELQHGLLSISRKHPETKADIIALLRGLDDRPVNGSRISPPLIEADAIMAEVSP